MDFWKVSDNHFGCKLEDIDKEKIDSSLVILDDGVIFDNTITQTLFEQLVARYVASRFYKSSMFKEITSNGFAIIDVHYLEQLYTVSVGSINISKDQSTYMCGVLYK